MSFLPYAVAGWLLLVGLHGIVTSLFSRETGFNVYSGAERIEGL